MNNENEIYEDKKNEKLKIIDSNVAIKSVRNLGYKMEYNNEGTK